MEHITNKHCIDIAYAKLSIANMQKTLIFNDFRKTMKNCRKSEHYSIKFCYTNFETLTSFGLLVTKYALCKRGERGKMTKTHTKA